jgi:glycine hydroxymethyltransferase
LTGKYAEKVLCSLNITCNKNTIPNDSEKPMISSGIRLGTPALTTRGMKEKEMIAIAHLIDKALRNHDNEELKQQVKEEVLLLTSKFPL